MPSTGQFVKNREKSLNTIEVRGLPVVTEGVNNPGELGISAEFKAITGTTLVPDVTYNQSANVTLIPSGSCPKGLRPYITACAISVNGGTTWAGASGIGIMVQDTNGAPIVWIPANALRGSSTYIFPNSEVDYPITQTVSSYAAATGVITLPATSLVSTSYVNNCIVTVLSGTGAGQSAIIASNTATTITPVGGAAAFPVALDNTSKVAVWYWAATAGAAGSVTVANQNGSATPLTANALDNGFNVVSVTGTSIGAVRPVSANTTSAISVAYNFNTNPSAGDLIFINTEPNLSGALDLGIGQQYPAAGTGTGIQVSVQGTFTGGSPIRVAVQGYWAP